MSAAAYAKANAGDWWTNKRMPDAATFESVDIVQAGNPVQDGQLANAGADSSRRTAPDWGYFNIGDIYTGANKGHSSIRHQGPGGRRDAWCSPMRYAQLALPAGLMASCPRKTSTPPLRRQDDRSCAVPDAGARDTGQNVSTVATLSVLPGV